jgi:hypothetical protein
LLEFDSLPLRIVLNLIAILISTNKTFKFFAGYLIVVVHIGFAMIAARDAIS